MKKSTLLLCLVPVAILLTVLSIFKVDVLFRDEWLVWSNMLHQMGNNQFGLRNLIAQQNEQRMASARIIGLLLYKPIGLHRLAACYVNVALAGIMFLLLANLYNKTLSELKIKKSSWPIVLMAFLIFSLLQKESFLLGVNNTFFISLICLFSGLILIADLKLNPGRFILILLLGLAGSFNTANGLFYWLCLSLPMFCLENRKKQKWIYLFLWFSAGCLVWLTYFHGYHRPPHHPSPWDMIGYPFSALIYFCVLLGHTITFGVNMFPLAVFLGFCGLIILALTLIKLKRKDLLNYKMPLIWLTLITYVILTLAAITAGRCGFGAKHALQGRYVTFTNLYWLSLLVLVIINKRTTNILPLKKKYVWVEAFIILVLGAVFIISSIKNARMLYYHAKCLKQAKEELFLLDEPEKLQPIFPDPNYLYTVLPIFFQSRQSIFRKIKQLQDYQLYKSPGGKINSYLLTERNGCQGLLFSGTVNKKINNHPVAFVLITADNKIIYATKPGSPQCETWQVFIPVNFFPDKNNSISAYALSNYGEIAKLKTNIDTTIQLTDLKPPEYDYSKYFYCLDTIKP